MDPADKPGRLVAYRDVQRHLFTAPYGGNSYWQLSQNVTPSPSASLRINFARGLSSLVHCPHSIGYGVTGLLTQEVFRAQYLDSSVAWLLRNDKGPLGQILPGPWQGSRL